MKSAPMQRLERINQYGIPKKYCIYSGFSRYEHSVGVLLLLRKLNADCEEQVAGLLHDISHTAFSHVVDWIIGNHEKEDYQDRLHNRFLKNSEIGTILKRHGFDIDRISDLKRFKILDKDIPQLCVDRLEYALREFKEWTNPGIVNKCLREIRVINENRRKNKKGINVRIIR